MFADIRVNLDIRSLIDGFDRFQLDQIQTEILGRIERLQDAAISDSEVMEIFQQKGKIAAIKAYRNSCGKPSLRMCMTHIDEVVAKFRKNDQCS